VVFHRFTGRGGAELGCRILPEYAGKGYGAEAFAAAADWGLYELMLSAVTAKCFKENEASFRMLSANMQQTGEDETFFYFRKEV
jgi:RimJ/RimL family protein N-acetyltransferase